MAGGKETPRQKMIGMMYLVLTALLALNVSKSILDAFVTQDEQGLEQNTRLVESINGIGTKISLGKSDPQSKKSAEEIEPIYNNLAKMANEVDDHFYNELNELFKVVEGREWYKKDQATQITSLADEEFPLDKMGKKDDYDSPSNFFGGEPGSPSYKRGEALRLKMAELRDKMILEVASEFKYQGKTFTISKNDLKDKKTFEDHLEKTKNPKKTALMDVYNMLTKPEKVMQHEEEKAWHIARFYHQPMVGVVGTVTSLRNDIRMAQQKASQMLLDRMETPMMNINKVEAQVLASTQYMNMGDKLDVKIGIVAYDSSKTYPILYRNGTEGDYTKVDSGKFTLEASSPGPKHIEGKLMVEIAGQLQERDWSFDYTVGKPSASIALPELNVFYRGYPNVVNAVASGYPPDQVKVSCDGCSSFSKKGENYVAQVSGAKEATVSVTVEGKKIGFQKFRVFNLPSPQPFFVGKSIETSTMASGTAKQGTKLIAQLPNSPLDVNYSITGFTMNAVLKGKVRDGGRSSNGTLNSTMKSLISQAQKGDKIYFEQVKAAGPDGKSKPIGQLSFKIL